MTDFLLLEQLHRMIKEIPKPRLMFRKGISASGYFRSYMPLEDFTDAAIFRDIDEITPVKVRFSSMIGDEGTPDTTRNVKGMEVKFITEEGDYDILCQSLPALFINDKDKLMDFFDVFAVKGKFDGIDKERFWTYVTKNPESINMALRLYSMEGLSDSYTSIKWFSVNTAIWKINGLPKYLVRYKWVPVSDVNDNGLNRSYLNRNSAEFIAGFDPNRAGNQLEQLISGNNYPSFEMCIQMANFENIENPEFTDSTLLWDESKNPYIPVGVMMLDELQDYDNAMSFAPGNIIWGIGIYKDSLTDIMEYICRIQALERGVCR